jgi:hypothetical protein
VLGGDEATLTAYIDANVGRAPRAAGDSQATAISRLEQNNLLGSYG